jgi:hypothetical protein
MGVPLRDDSENIPQNEKLSVEEDTSDRFERSNYVQSQEHLSILILKFYTSRNPIQKKESNTVFI